MSLPMTLEDPGDMVQPFVGTHQGAFSDLDNEKDGIRAGHGEVYNVNAEGL